MDMGTVWEIPTSGLPILNPTDWDTHVSISTIFCTVQSLALSHKCLSAAAIERNELLRATWWAEYGDTPANYFVWLDESSVDNCTNQRTEGWALQMASMLWISLRAP
jgi:hypothetical protein